jgi:hypothetical protein
MEFLKSIPSEYYLYAGLAILLLGIIPGFTKTITVYRDYADLTKTFMIVLAPVALFILLGDKTGENVLRNILFAIESLLIVWILVTTYLDNRNIFKALLAFITKIPLSVIFSFYLINLISPAGSKMGQRRQSRGISAIIMLFLAPILYGLVRNKAWSAKKESDA